MLYFLGTPPEGATGRPTLLLLLPPCAWWKWRYSCILWILFELLGGLTCLISFYFYFLVLAIQTLQLRPNKGEMFWPTGHHQCFGRPFCVWGHFSWIVIEVLGVGFEHVSFFEVQAFTVRVLRGEDGCTMAGECVRGGVGKEESAHKVHVGWSFKWDKHISSIFFLIW